MARAIFIGGTASNAGKSWTATAMCRLLARRGWRVAPFKAQNMSNNSFPCREGGEIGRSQVAQAEACGIEPQIRMNPVLLKPLGDSCSQVILHGQVWKTIPARDYYQHSSFLRQEAIKAYHELASDYDFVVIEGAGSVAEINLGDGDFTNLSMAQAAGARALLVADVERGGVFASILGTLDLLAPEYRKLIRAFAVNRFRGDRTLFHNGKAILEERSGLPCLGVFPFDGNIHLDAEDSLATAGPSRTTQESDVAIIRFPRISNTTDFRLLQNAAWLEEPAQKRFRTIILPGTKATIPDLLWLRESGLADWIVAQHRDGAAVVGICGGYQMLGERIDDPSGTDGMQGSASGLGLLPVLTEMAAAKTTRIRQARTVSGTRFGAYEIHMGRTTVLDSANPFAFLEDGTPEGIVLNRITGTYLHGAFESADVIQDVLGFRPPEPSKDGAYDALADWMEAHASPVVLNSLTGDGASQNP